jgi:hypothetical protein
LIRLNKPHESRKRVILASGCRGKGKGTNGYVIKAGPGYALPMPPEDEPGNDDEKVKYSATGKRR